MNTIELERIRFGMQQAVSAELLDAQIEGKHDRLVDQFVYTLRGYLWGESQKGYEYSYPADWWQAFKKRWFPNWAKRKWPILYTVIKVDVNVVYPDLKISMPTEKYRVLIQGGVKYYNHDIVNGVA